MNAACLILTLTQTAAPSFPGAAVHEHLGAGRYLAALAAAERQQHGAEAEQGLARTIHEASSETSQMPADAGIGDREHRRRP